MARTKQTARKVPYDGIEKYPTRKVTSATSPPNPATNEGGKKVQPTTQPTPETVPSDTENKVQTIVPEVSNNQNTADDNLIISKSVFRSLVQDAIQKNDLDLQFQQLSLDTMQAYMEDYLTAVMEQADFIAKQEGRDAVEGKDIARARPIVEQKMAEAAVEREAAAGGEASAKGEDLTMTDGGVGEGVY